MDRYYTAGELAKIAGVSSRTIRYYDEKGILKPISYSEEEYRLYDNNSVIVLQQILMLKYVGFSLEEISEIIKQDKEISLKHILEKQKILMFQKKTQIEQIIYALDSAVKVCEKSSPDLQHFTEIMQLITKNDLQTDVMVFMNDLAVDRKNGINGVWRTWSCVRICRFLMLGEGMEPLGCVYGNKFPQVAILSC